MSVINFRLNNKYPWLIVWDYWSQNVADMYLGGTFSDSAVTLFCLMR